MAEPLGALQPVWDAWNETHDDMVKKPLSHFERAVELQLIELRQHLAANDPEAAARELIDLISISLNGLRWLGYSPDRVAELARSRAADRMDGQTRAILDKYQRLYDI